MPPEPTAKRADVFIDGQNLFHAVRESFGYTYPNYDVLALADAVCKAQGWTLAQARFYTGIPDPTDNPFWHHFWSAKLAVMGRQGVVVFSRSLRYRNKTVTLPDATELTLPVGEEKGVDIRIALDVIRMATAETMMSRSSSARTRTSQKSPTRSGSSPKNGADGSDRLGISARPHDPKPSRHQPDRPRDVRRLPRPSRLPPHSLTRMVPRAGRLDVPAAEMSERCQKIRRATELPP